MSNSTKSINNSIPVAPTTEKSEQVTPATEVNSVARSLSDLFQRNSNEAKQETVLPVTPVSSSVNTQAEERDTAKEKAFHPVPSIIGKRRKKAEEYNKQYNYDHGLSNTLTPKRGG